MRAMRVLWVAAVASAVMGMAEAGGGGDGARQVEGQVIAVRLSEATANQGAFQEIQVRTREREEIWLRLGPADGTGPRFEVGDRLRARAVTGEGGGPLLVTKIRNDRSGERATLRDGTGDGVPDRGRQRDRLQDNQAGRGHGPCEGGGAHGGRP